MYPKEEEREFSDFEDKLMGRLGHQESFAAHQAYLEACFERNDYSTKLQDIKVPVLIMHGKQDNVWPVDNAIYLSHHIRGSKLELFEQIGADLFNEHESLVINKIAEFVNA